MKFGGVTFNNSGLIAENAVNHFKDLFDNVSVLQDNSLVEDVILKLVSDQTNFLLTMLPTELEVHSAIFNLNKDSAAGPDGFGPRYNSNTLVLIPKVKEADSIEQFRPIALANFKFKIITKILADRLAKVLPLIISKEKNGFISGRSIRDCICLTSEAANSLHRKTLGGNIILKVDIAKAFDTLSWKFILKVLHQFGFCEKFCLWIKCILSSAKVSIALNGQQHVFFNCQRGVRQGDPLSPMFFCLDEDVLSRVISKLVSDNKVKLMHASRNVMFPSHTLYADDIILFSRGCISSIEAFKGLFSYYAECSGQVCNPSKSVIYAGSMSNDRHSLLANLVGFCKGQLPFYYLGVPIFKGRPKAIYFQPLADKIKAKLAAWKASLLSIAGRVQLVMSVIQSMTVYSIMVYSWPISLIKIIEGWCRNFIWSVDMNKRKLVTVAWKLCCRSLKDGGLGIRSLRTLNDVADLRQCWTIYNGRDDWAQILKSRVFKRGKRVQYHVFSSIWSGSMYFLNIIEISSMWLVGNGENINLWSDNWNGYPLKDRFIEEPLAVFNGILKDFIYDDKIVLPPELFVSCPDLRQVCETTVINSQAQDCVIWKPSDNGFLTLKEAYYFCCRPIQSSWGRVLWNRAIPHSKSLLFWRLFHGKLPTDNNLRLREGSHSAQCHVVILAAILNTVASIWNARNLVRFQNKKLLWKSHCASIISLSSMSGNLTQSPTNSSMSDFVILKHFPVSLNPPRTRSSIEVLWFPPQPGWVKGDHLGSFCSNLGSANALFAELMGAILAMEIAIGNGWLNLWLESDSSLVVSAFSNSMVVPWKLRNRWDSCLFKLYVSCHEVEIVESLNTNIPSIPKPPRPNGSIAESFRMVLNILYLNIED
ncbi:uncharacterized protein LOC131658194 [Vicia villosa]|uniref:uncharacterized protein LOC131658194 n=1 Tax=Vicia villosa TaxID=3911 RepID=UPI00273AA466|nr:uncharacterized protein LOC131658194 [Vicia villosa]